MGKKSKANRRNRRKSRGPNEGEDSDNASSNASGGDTNNTSGVSSNSSLQLDSLVAPGIMLGGESGGKALKMPYETHPFPSDRVAPSPLQKEITIRDKAVAGDDGNQREELPTANLPASTMANGTAGQSDAATVGGTYPTPPKTVSPGPLTQSMSKAPAANTANEPATREHVEQNCRCTIQ